MKIISFITFLVILGTCSAFAERAIVSGSEITTPHLTASLVSSAKQLRPGEKFQAGIYFQIKKNWHLYWQNPGDSGEPPKFRWWQNANLEVKSPIAWPIPERIAVGPLANFGYKDSVTLAQEFQLSKKAKVGQKLELRLSATWLVCEEICVPEKGEFSLVISVANETLPTNTPLVFEKKLPKNNTDWLAQEVDNGPQNWSVELHTKKTPQLNDWDFFPLQPGLVNAGKMPKVEIISQGLRFIFQRNGEIQANSTAGLLVGRKDGKAEVFLYPKTVSGIASPSLALAENTKSEIINGEKGKSSDWGVFSLLWSLVGAFLGGLILNIMPCVFPVLAIKAMHFVRTGSNKEEKKESLFYTFGVWLSFISLAFLLIFMRRAGAEIGWGFQLQSPIVLAGLYVLFLLLGLNFFGVFEWGNRIANFAGGVKVGEGASGSFFTGVLATAVATPCTAPFMGSAIGLALLAPWWAAIGIFSAMALGMALPILVLAFFPRLATHLPKAGSWMLYWKQFFGFMLLATCVWLLWVWQKVNTQLDVANILLASICLAIFFWAWELSKKANRVWFLRLIQFISIIIAILFFRNEMLSKQEKPYGGLPVWEYSEANLKKIHSEKRIAYVDFTASWCLSCQVNKKIVFGSSALVEKFKKHEIVILRADWTNHNPEIAMALSKYGRAGVPLNIIMGPGDETPPEILPTILSPGLVAAALEKRLK